VARERNKVGAGEKNEIKIATTGGMRREF